MTSGPKNKKFLFDLHHFDKEEEEEKRKQKAPPVPTFSLDDMEKARADSFEKGKAEGLQAAKDSITQRTELVVQSLAGQVAALEAEETQRSEEFKAKSVALIYQTLHKAFPELLDQGASAQIKIFLSDFFQDTRIKSNFMITVHPDILAQIEPYVDQLSQTANIKGDANLRPNASKIEWDTGSAYFDPDTMADKILGIIREQIAEKAELLDGTVKNPHNEIKTDDSSTDGKDD